jgi:hypothetical protein
MNVTWLTAIAIAMKALKGFDDDEEPGEEVVKEIFQNLAGMIPLGSEFYSVLQPR